ncbi:hypothetical protein [Streptomyces lydicus]|uniref:hypothetical protein n=1 Tax=Streptomyces lydicus TaxID=47763 RepID=UPI0028706D9F|nr:hypothetical protein [Streptomyces lydicus]
MGTTRTTEKRTDDETVPAQAGGAATETAALPETTEAEATAKASAKADERTDENAVLAEQDESSDAEAEDDTADLGDTEADHASARPATGVAAGAGAVVAAGLGLASVTGTWLGTLMAERQTLMGQIKLQTHQATDQISAMYGTPWHTTALVNGVFALLAGIVAAVVLSRPRAGWVRAVAWGGLALAVLGILISAGMYLDLFGSMPSIPKGAAPGA